jgi:hypothetical protein
MGGNSLEPFCLEASYIEAFNILNLPSLTIPDSQQLFSNLSWLALTNITTYTDGPTSILLDSFKYEENTSLPLTKPLAIQCPVPACIFPISGYFTFLQRILLYINIAVATFALPVPLLRGVSQIWLTTFWFSVLGMFLATVIITKVPMIYNLDLQPAALVVHIGLLPTLLWFSFRAEPGKPRDHAKRGRDTENPDEPDEPQVPNDSYYPENSLRPENTEDPEIPEAVETPQHPGVSNGEENATEKSWWKRNFLDFPVTRILIPAYALWGVMNIIMANVFQDSAGFWPKATAVILSNGTNYLLTSPCFEDPTGFVGLWPSPPSPYHGLRSLNNSLSIYYPPPGSKAVDALQAVPKIVYTVLHVGSVLICFFIIILSFYTLSQLKTALDSR